MKLEKEKIREIILENNGRICSCKHNILLMKNQISGLTKQNKELKKTEVEDEA
ncbi:hypothetical protein KAI04_04230 [Candidatus Pacearchaeota archaeon]|nr:hypothetical protein [Candidatus Pacearchaeota archaeon]